VKQHDFSVELAGESGNIASGSATAVGEIDWEKNFLDFAHKHPETPPGGNFRAAIVLIWNYVHLKGQNGLAAIALLPLLVTGWAGLGAAQQLPAVPVPAGPLPEQTQQNAALCFEPPRLIRWEDYHGPLKRIVGAVGRAEERTAVHPPHYRTDAVLCSLAPKEKFDFFVATTLDPLSFLSAGFNAVLDTGGDGSFGQGAAGYGKRFGAAFADQTSARFFAGFVYPTLFSEDPRYYRLAYGSAGKRLLHAAEHVFIGHSDSGKRMFNFSEWLGTGSAVALGYAWHPDNKPGLRPGVRAVGYVVAEDIGFDILREFWPEIAHKLRLPFRDIREPGPDTSKP
jgi:hypothetical protein